MIFCCAPTHGAIRSTQPVFPQCTLEQQRCGAVKRCHGPVPRPTRAHAHELRMTVVLSGCGHATAEHVHQCCQTPRVTTLPPAHFFSKTSSHSRSWLAVSASFLLVSSSLVKRLRARTCCSKTCMCSSLALLRIHLQQLTMSRDKTSLVDILLAEADLTIPEHPGSHFFEF